MSPATCAECDRRWSEYIDAVTARLKIVAGRHKALLRNDAAALDEISGIEAGLIERELKARRAIVEHEASH